MKHIWKKVRATNKLCSKHQYIKYLLCLLGLHGGQGGGGGGGKLNSLARSNASLYGTKDDLYDRLKRHAYTGKKGKWFF